MYQIKNISGETQDIHGFWDIDEIKEIDESNLFVFQEIEIFNAIENEIFALFIDSEQIGINTALAILKNSFLSSWAVDANNEDQSLSGNDWIVMQGKRTIWDLENGYDSQNNIFKIPYDALYFLDGQFHFKELSNVTFIEIAVWKKETPEDDYWFILDKKEVISGQTEIQLSAATLFDFYEDEEYQIKVKLYGDNPSCKLDGDDDYTAWGCNCNKRLY